MKITSNGLPVVRNCLFQGDFASILEIAARQNRILSLLTALTYDTDPLVSDRAVEATGLVAKQIVQRDPEYVRNYLLRLFWLISDESGGICWRGPELIGEILYNCPQFTQFHPMLISLLDLENEDAARFRVSTLRGIRRVQHFKLTTARNLYPYTRYVPRWSDLCGVIGFFYIVMIDYHPK